MSAKKSFCQLIEERNEILWAPCIYDCVSAKCAETIGFEAVTISSVEQMHSFVGQPIMSMDEMLISAEKIIESTGCAVLVDGEDGGGTPMEVYRNVKRIAQAGAMAISIEDKFRSNSIGVSVIGVESRNKTLSLGDPYMPAELWAANVAAAIDACRGTDCMVIARVDSKGCENGHGPKKFKGLKGLGLEEAIRRAQIGVEVGAKMTMIQNICYRGGRPEWEEIQKRVPGWHAFPDIHADDGVSDVDDVKELYDLGFQLITCHAFQKGAWKGMMEYGTRLFRDKNTIFTENDDFGFPIWQISPMTFPEWSQRCGRYIDTYKKMKDYKAK
jgi:methylisocitrate lyase